MIFFICMFSQLGFLQKTLLEIVPVFTDSHSQRSACFTDATSATLTGDAIDTHFTAEYSIILLPSEFYYERMN
jgi:hypothetical protein